MRDKLKNIKENTGLMKYLKNTSWLFFEKILRMLIGLLISIWVARYLGPEKLGLLSYAQSFVGLFTAIATLGLNTLVVRELLKDNYEENELISTVFFLKLIGAIVVLVILWVAIQFTSNDAYTNNLIFIIGSATIFQSFNVIDFYFQSKVLSKYVVYVNSVSLFLSTIIKIVLILNNASLEAFAFVILFDSFILGLGYIYFFLKKSTFNVSYLHFNKAMAKSLLKDSLFYMFTAMIIGMYMRIDQVMIQEMMDSKQVGYYAVAAKLSELWYFLPVIISSSLYPAIENAKKVSYTLYYKRLERLFVLTNLIAVVIIIPTLFLSHFLITSLYGEVYILSVVVLQIHIINLLFAFQRISSESWVMSENHKYFEVIKTLFGLVSNVILNLFLIPKYGIVGAAIATVVSMAITGYFVYALYSKSRVIFKMMTRTIFFLNIKLLKEGER